MGSMIALPLGVVAISSALLCLVLRRWVQDPVLKKVILASFGLRVALACAFYLVSYFRLPTLASLQLGQGFWLLAPDAQQYDQTARWYLGNMAAGLPLPVTEVRGPFGYFVIWIYRLMGPEPLNVILLNPAAAALAAVVASRLAEAMSGDAGRARLVGVLVALWPSSFIWSAMLLKDSLSALFVLLLAYLITLGLRWAQGGGPLPARRAWTFAAGVLFASVGLVALREYVLTIFLFAFAATTAAAGMLALWRRDTRRVGRYVFLGALVLSLMGAAQVGVRGVGSASPFGLDDAVKQIRGIIMQFGAQDADLPLGHSGLAAPGGLSNRTGDAGAAGDFSLARKIGRARRALCNFWLAPYPWQWTGPTGETGVFLRLSSLEMLLIYFILGTFVLSRPQAAFRHENGAAVLMLSLLLLAASISAGLNITNAGTLFRLRMQFFFLFLVLWAAALRPAWLPRPLRGHEESARACHQP